MFAVIFPLRDIIFVLVWMSAQEALLCVFKYNISLKEPRPSFLRGLFRYPSTFGFPSQMRVLQNYMLFATIYHFNSATLELHHMASFWKSSISPNSSSSNITPLTVFPNVLFIMK